MKWWPWSRRPSPEKRSTYTDAITGAFVTAAEDGPESAPLATAALEAATGLYGRCMAAAVVAGAPALEGALSAPVLALMARSLIRRGESLHRIVVRRGRLMLVPIAYVSVFGRGADPEGWMYQATEYGPTDTRHFWLPAAAVVHVRYSVDPARPWIGVPPWSWASDTGAAVAALDRLVAGEAGAPHGTLLGVPEAPQTGEDDDTRQLDSFRADLSKAKGRTLVVERAGDWNPDAGATTGRGVQFELSRFGMAPADAAVARTETGRDVLGACGVPPSLYVANSDGTAQREAFRRFLHGSLRPLARLIEVELREKLDAPGLSLDLTPVGAADVAGRARSFKAFVESGMDPEDAARETGVTLTRPVRRESGNGG